MSRTVQTVDLHGYTLEVTNLDKPLWPEEGITKADLIHYYVAVAPYLLPHLEQRLLTVTRYPDGITGDSFYQKNCPEYAPDWIPTHPVPSRDRVIHYIVADKAPTLAWLANQATLELHPSLARLRDLDKPDVAVVDLDPDPPAGFPQAREVAQMVKQVLDDLGLAGFPKLSGATGIHVYIPIIPHYPYRQVSAFVGSIGEALADRYPDLVTNERLIKNRRGRVYVDHLQNLPGKTIVAPYSPRPRPGAPVSMPITWEELPECHPTDFRMDNVIARLEQIGDLFAPLQGPGQSLRTWIQERSPANGS